MQTVDGHDIHLTHKGERNITTDQGTLRLGTVYYAKGVQLRLISVSKLADSGLKTVFTHDLAYIGNGYTKIELKRSGDLWTIPEVRRTRVVALRMETGGTADSVTWHQRMGHPGNQKTVKMIEQGILPTGIEPEMASRCTPCKKTNPR